MTNKFNYVFRQIEPCVWWKIPYHRRHDQSILQAQGHFS